MISVATWNVRGLCSDEKKAETLEENCNEKKASVVKDTSSNLVDTAVKIDKRFRLKTSHIRNRTNGSSGKNVLKYNQGNIDYTSTRYLNQQRNEVTLDTKEQMKRIHWDDVEAGNQSLPQKNVGTKLVFKTEVNCPQCHQTFEEVFFLNNHIRFVHGHETTNDKVRLRGGHLRMKNAHMVR